MVRKGYWSSPHLLLILSHFPNSLQLPLILGFVPDILLLSPISSFLPDIDFQPYSGKREPCLGRMPAKNEKMRWVLSQLQFE